MYANAAPLALTLIATLRVAAYVTAPIIRAWNGWFSSDIALHRRR
jgi:hypothetical protein